MGVSNRRKRSRSRSRSSSAKRNKTSKSKSKSDSKTPKSESSISSVSASSTNDRRSAPSISSVSSFYTDDSKASENELREEKFVFLNVINNIKFLIVNGPTILEGEPVLLRYSTRVYYHDGRVAEHEEIEDNPNMRCSNCGDRNWEQEH